MITLIGGPMDSLECDWIVEERCPEIRIMMPQEHAGSHPPWINEDGIATRSWPQYRYVLQPDGSYQYGGTL